MDSGLGTTNRQQIGLAPIALKRAPETSRLSRLHALAADLEIEAVWILNVETVLCIWLRVKPATLQFRLHSILVPVLDGVRNVIDSRRGAPLRGVARNHKRICVANDQAALGACISDDLHSQQIRVEVPRLLIVADLVRN